MQGVPLSDAGLIEPAHVEADDSVGPSRTYPSISERRQAMLRSRRRHAMALGAAAIGALAVGAFAVGAFAIGRLAIGRLAVGRSTLKSLKIGELSVDRLRVANLDVVNTLTLPPGVPVLHEHPKAG